MEHSYIAIGNDELDGNKILIPGEFIPCRNCGAMCEIKTTLLKMSEGSLETTKCASCGKVYLVGVDCVSLWEKEDEVS